MGWDGHNTGMAEFDADLAAALAASVADHQATHETLVLDSSFSCQRSSIQQPGAAARHRAAAPRDGELGQLNLWDQFNSTFNGLVAEHSAPSAICGYVSCALARKLAARLPAAAGGVSRSDALAAAEALRDAEALKPELRTAMAFVRDSRERWMAAHPADFASDAARGEYLTAWVANMEISDFLSSLPPEEVSGVVFLRFNQWPERTSATHEEAARLATEESRFGGAVGDKGDATLYSDSDSMFVVEDFGAEAEGVAGDGPTLRTPREWLSARRAGEEPPRVFVLDLNGHFCVAVPHTTPAAAEEGEGGSPEGARGLLLLNTTQASYLGGSGGLIASVAFDLAFPPPAQ